MGRNIKNKVSDYVFRDAHRAENVVWYLINYLPPPIKIADKRAAIGLTVKISFPQLANLSMDGNIYLESVNITPSRGKTTNSNITPATKIKNTKSKSATKNLLLIILNMAYRFFFAANYSGGY